MTGECPSPFKKSTTELEVAKNRIIAASNKNLEDEVENGRFRHDLYYRLNVIPIKAPALLSLHVSLRMPVPLSV